ncbi:MAG TPA: D-glycero-beta-D-manno-heptose-7-phosphate kinase [Verrucomicrobiota bacterium]|nr:D-glycero-beta-D-manno-heptose-7-phosphate kinase [Verrucomicrobiota bacterium]HNU49523.1 D-glycero-beta-D-manno-heptose-7-phosphate kinase [Verrucomicrobiota bacterium]
MNPLTPPRVSHLLATARRCRILVVGDVMLDQFLWGRVNRISPEAPVPVVDFDRESFMPGGAANVARNLTALGAEARLVTVVGADDAGRRLHRLLEEHQVDCSGLHVLPKRGTSIKTRIIAHQQQMVRVDRETRTDLDPPTTAALVQSIDERLEGADAVIVGDYGKGVVTQALLDALKPRCRQRGLWVSVDPKPVHRLDLRGLSLITPNRKEAFELAGAYDSTRTANPLADPALLRVARSLLADLQPALLLITLGEQGMLLCQRDAPPFPIPTTSREVFEVSGAGDTVIASFTLAVAAGASPAEAAVFSNHAAGVVVGKVGTATVSPEELLASFHTRR